MSTTPLFEIVKARVNELNTWTADNCPGASYVDLSNIAGNREPIRALTEALNRIDKFVGLITDGHPIKIALDNEGFSGDRVPFYIAALGASRGRSVHDLIEASSIEIN